MLPFFQRPSSTSFSRITNARTVRTQEKPPTYKAVCSEAEGCNHDEAADDKGPVGIVASGESPIKDDHEVTVNNVDWSEVKSSGPSADGECIKVEDLPCYEYDASPSAATDEIYSSDTPSTVPDASWESDMEPSFDGNNKADDNTAGQWVTAGSIIGNWTATDDAKDLGENVKVQDETEEADDAELKRNAERMRRFLLHVLVTEYEVDHKILLEEGDWIYFVHLSKLVNALSRMNGKVSDSDETNLLTLYTESQIDRPAEYLHVPVHAVWRMLQTFIPCMKVSSPGEWWVPKFCLSSAELAAKIVIDREIMVPSLIPSSQDAMHKALLDGIRSVETTWFDYVHSPTCYGRTEPSKSFRDQLPMLEQQHRDLLAMDPADRDVRIAELIVEASFDDDESSQTL